MYLQDAKELNFIKDLLSKYNDAPIKIFVGKEKYTIPAELKGHSFSQDEVAAAV